MSTHIKNKELQIKLPKLSEVLSKSVTQFFNERSNCQTVCFFSVRLYQSFLNHTVTVLSLHSIIFETIYLREQIR